MNSGSLKSKVCRTRAVSLVETFTMYTTRSEKLHRPGGMEGFQFHCNLECNNHVKNPKFSCNFRMTT